LKYTPFNTLKMAKKVNNNTEVKVSIELEHFDGELEFICTGKSRHLKADLKINLTHAIATIFKRLGYIK